jgi:hypothetical protein
MISDCIKLLQSNYVLQVCDTYAENKIGKTNSRRKRAAGEARGYFEKETMFILSESRAAIYNSAPELDSQTEVNIMEDSGIVLHNSVVISLQLH